MTSRSQVNSANAFVSYLRATPDQHTEDEFLQSSTSTTTTLTVILPAYNESLRIENTLRLYHDYLSLSVQWKQRYNSHLLVIDDGSTDGTAEVVQSVAATLISDSVSVECISLPTNQGKGAAISQGIQHVASRLKTNDNYKDSSNGAGFILVADADGSADITCLDSMAEELSQSIRLHQTSCKVPRNNSVPAMVVGKRQYPSTSFNRAILRQGFRTAVRVICGDLNVSDTQCGFKLLTLPAGLKLYQDLNLRGWSHDCEVLYRAKLLGIPVAEANVPWEDKPGSKLVTSAGGTMGASLRMLLDIIQLRVYYTLGLWRLPSDDYVEIK